MLQNAYLVAKIGADTAANERNFAEILPKTGNYPTGPLPYGSPGPLAPPAGRRGACRRPPRTPRASRSEAPRSGGPCVLGASATWREGGVILCNAYKQPTCQAFAPEIFEYLWRRFLQHAMNSDNYLGFPSMLATFCENLSFRRKLTNFDWISKNFAAFSELQTINRNSAKLFK